MKNFVEKTIEMFGKDKVKIEKEILSNKSILYVAYNEFNYVAYIDTNK